MNRVSVCAASRILYTSSVSSKNSMPFPGTCPTCTRGAIVSLLLPMTHAKQLQFQMFFSLSGTLKHHSSSSSSSWFLHAQVRLMLGNCGSFTEVGRDGKDWIPVHSIGANTNPYSTSIPVLISQPPHWGCSYQPGNLTLECDDPISQQKHLWCRQQRQRLQMARIKKHFNVCCILPKRPCKDLNFQKLTMSDVVCSHSLVQKKNKFGDGFTFHCIKIK